MKTVIVFNIIINKKGGTMFGYLFKKSSSIMPLIVMLQLHSANMAMGEIHSDNLLNESFQVHNGNQHIYDIVDVNRGSDSSITNAITLLLNKRQLSDLELLLNDGFAPLTGFMNQADYNSVVENLRLADNTVWPMPITLDVNEQMAQKLATNKTLALRSPEGAILAYLQVEDIWKADKLKEAQHVFGTTNPEHPGVAYLLQQTKEYYVGGKLIKKELPTYFDFNELRKTPAQLKQEFKDKGYTKIVAFQTRNPLHRAHYELTRRAAEAIGGHLLLHPSVGVTKPGDVDHFTRVKCYKKLMKYYPENSATLSLLPLAMRMAGPREALWHAIIRKNYGCTHFIVGRDHAGPGKDSSGKDFYGPYDAQKLVLQYAQEIGMEILTFQEMVYLADKDTYMPIDQVPQGSTVLSISGTQFRTMLNKGLPIPTWFSFPEVIEELQKSYPSKNKQGITLFFTGLSGSGKSTVANAVAVKLTEILDRPITLLDGDDIRTYLSSELGFSKEHRSINVRRVGFVANEIAKHRGIGITALIAPYQADRQHVRNLVSQHGGFVEIYISTPLSVCEERDVKGLYKLAREGKIPQFTGISDPYEAPLNPELTMDTSNMSLEEASQTIIDYLGKEGYLS
jgi:sulfate adenylyltransferase